MKFETKITAKFIPDMPPTTIKDKAKLDELNKEAEDVVNRLQATFRNLVIEMLSLKRGV